MPAAATPASGISLPRSGIFYFAAVMCKVLLGTEGFLGMTLKGVEILEPFGTSIV